jgi:hypothetical protein
LSRKKTRVADHASRLLPSISAWLRASECMSAAAWSANPGAGTETFGSQVEITSQGRPDRCPLGS